MAVKKLLVWDCETGSLDPTTGALLTISGDIYYDMGHRDSFHFDIKPMVGDLIDDEALMVNGLTREKIRGFMEPQRAYKELCMFFGQHIRKFNKFDKFYSIGYNSKFDYAFLDSFFRKNDDPYLGSWINPRFNLDLYEVVKFLVHTGHIPELPNLKLSTVCEHYGIKFDAHDSLEDIKATFSLYKRLKSILPPENNEEE